jgi:membrane protease YdiL (CAAX protease family)
LRSLWRFVLAVVVTYFANVLAGGFAAGAGRGRLFELTYRSLALVFVLAGYSLLLIVADRVDGNPLSAMGLALRGPWLRDIAVGLGLGFAMIAVAVTVIAAAGDLSINIGAPPRAFQKVIIVVLTLVSGAMLEEAMFRGYPFQRLVESATPVGGILILSALFGAVHLGNPSASIWSFLNTTAVGVLFCIAYLRTQSLWMPWAIHFCWNAALGLVFGLPVSGLTSFAVVVRSKAAGPDWLTGGAYGIEASALGTFVILLGIVAVVVLVKPRPSRQVAVTLSDIGPQDSRSDENPAERIQM